ncbi:hypothetical protein HQ544_02780 [Candidatus Falkowbacteria bacterium]|nr:hypothetical protein [Candidatus Falkowbacteria bacterium]
MPSLAKILTPYIVPILVFISLEWMFASPASGWIFLIIIFLLVISSLFYIIGFKINKKNLKFLLPSFLFLLAFLSFFSFLIFADFFFRHFFAVIVVVLLSQLLKKIFIFFHAKTFKEDYSDFFSYFNILTVFMIFTSLGSAGIFLGVSSWILFFLAAVFLLLVFYNNYYIRAFIREQGQGKLRELLDQKIDDLIGQQKAQKDFYILIPALVLIELFWAVSFLPTSFYVNALILTVSYYIISGLIKNRLNNNLTKQIIQKYAIIASACFLLIIFTARI